MQKSFCPSCGKRIAAKATVCRSCGADVGVATALLPPPDAPTIKYSPPAARPRKSRAKTAKTPRPSVQNRILEDLRAATMGAYEIGHELGRGGMATIYVARDLALDRKVAIKVMAPALVHDGAGVERFKREARTAGSLSHPHIVPVHAVRESGDLVYFVMKLVEGRSLDAVVREEGRLPVPMVVRILTEVADALAHAHRKGVVHRDVKPANILLDRDGWAMVTDFGIAKLEQEQGLTATGATVGTPAYMSPEQCMAREVTGQSDQYSLGIVAWELLTGRAPFSAHSMMELFESHVHHAPPPLRQACPDCPPGLAAIVERMIAKDPAERWPSLDDVVTRLSELRDGTGGRTPGLVARPIAAQQPADTGGWMPLVVWIAILVPMVALIGWLALTVGDGPDRPPAPVSRPAVVDSAVTSDPAPGTTADSIRQARDSTPSVDADSTPAAAPDSTPRELPS